MFHLLPHYKFRVVLSIIIESKHVNDYYYNIKGTHFLFFSRVKTRRSLELPPVSVALYSIQQRHGSFGPSGTPVVATGVVEPLRP